MRKNIKTAKDKQASLPSLLMCESEMNKRSHDGILEASRHREENLKKGLRLVLLRDIEHYYRKVLRQGAGIAAGPLKKP